MASSVRYFLLTCAVLFGSWIQAMPVHAAEPPVAILVDGFGDCCAHRMTRLIDGLKELGVEFPAVKARGLSGDRYSDYTVPWNSFSGLDQGFNVDLDPQKYVQLAIQEAATSATSGSLSGGFASLANMQDSLADPSVIDKVMQKIRKGTDAKFVEEVSVFVNALPTDRKVILIGHSFGADSVMEVAPKLKRKVLFLGAVDAVGAGGQRRLNRKREISENVEYFYNRWQENGVFPFDFSSGGNFKDCRASVKCDQEKFSAGNAGHVDLPATAAIQSAILEIISGLLTDATPSKTAKLR